MVTSRKTPYFLSALASLAVATACSGGGGSTLPGPSPTPTPTPALTGTLNVVSGGTMPSDVTYAAASNATVVFSCGCNPQAGTSTTSGSGGFTLVANSTPTPAAPNPTYTIVPGRNYLVVARSAGGAEAWTMQFAGRVPSRDGFLNGSNPSDVYTAAVGLYVFQNSTSSATAFDDWNFNTLVTWHGTLTTSPNSSETKLLDDIISQSVLNHSLYPSHPGWNPSQSPNPLIAADIAAVKISGDSTLPTPCPSAGCTGTPTP